MPVTDLDPVAFCIRIAVRVVMVNEHFRRLGANEVERCGCAIWAEADILGYFGPRPQSPDKTDPETGLTSGYLQYSETQSNRVFVTVDCLYGFKTAMADGIQRIGKL